MKKLNKENNNELLMKEYREIALEDNDATYSRLKTNITGLTTKEAKKRLEENGKNVTIKEQKRNAGYFFLVALGDEFVLVLIFLSIT